MHEHKGGVHTLAVFKSIRAARPDGAPIYIVCDNPSCNTTPAIRAWPAAHKVDSCLTPTSASWANVIEAKFGRLRMFTMASSKYPNHTALAFAALSGEDVGVAVVGVVHAPDPRHAITLCIDPVGAVTEGDHRM